MKKLLSAFYLIAVFSLHVYSQETISSTEEDVYNLDVIDISKETDKMPEFPGGQKALMQFITKNLNFPKEAAINGTQGRVVVKFVIDKEGKVRNARAIKKVNFYLDREALRVVNELPKWKPAEKDSEPINVYFNLPIVFRLQR